MILSIDPGTTKSAWVTFRDGKPRAFAIHPNEELLVGLRLDPYRADVFANVTVVVIEKVESFGMAVGADIFETVRWAGRFEEAAQPLPVHRIGRRAVKLHLCGSARAKDANVRQALLDRYGGKDTAIGRKAAPGPLYGVSADVWSALAVAVTWADGKDTRQED